MRMKREKKKMRMRLLIRGNEENTCVITEVGKTKKMTYNLCLWLEQLHALGAWLDHGSI